MVLDTMYLQVARRLNSNVEIFVHGKRRGGESDSSEESLVCSLYGLYWNRKGTFLSDIVGKSFGIFNMNCTLGEQVLFFDVVVGEY